MTEPEPETTSPDTSPPVPDMATLFCTDPLNLTHNNITGIITHMRSARHISDAGIAIKKKAKLTTKETATKKLGLKLDLGDIGL